MNYRQVRRVKNNVLQEMVELRKRVAQLKIENNALHKKLYEIKELVEYLKRNWET